MTAPIVQVRGSTGTRSSGLPCTLGGGPGDDLRIPAGDGDGSTLAVFDREDGAFGLRAVAVASLLRLNGQLLASDAFHELAEGDVLSIGDARIVVDAVGERPVLDVRHLAGNETLPPLRAPLVDETAEDAAVAHITAVAADAMSGHAAPAVGAAGSAADDPAAVAAQHRRRRAAFAIASLAALLVGLVVWVVRSVQPVTLVVTPEEATVRGSGIGWRSGGLLFLRPGPQVVTARAEGYRTVTRTVQVQDGVPLRLELRLEPLPGVLELDTGGVPAQVFIDGAEAGRAPGAIEVAAGERTVLLRAPRSLDAVQKVTVQGRGVRQPLRIEMRSSWGRLEASAAVRDATLSVDGAAPVPLPASLELPAGMHRLEVTAPGSRPWRSAVVVKAGDTLRIGPIELGAPDMTVAVRSRPAGAEVTVGGAFRGRTPLDVEVVPGLEHEFALALQGYAPATVRIRGEAGQRETVSVALQPVMVALTVQGEPAEAEVLVDGAVRGKAPLTLQLPARPYRVEVRRAGSGPQRFDVDLSAAVARTVDYSLAPEGRPAGWKPAPATITTSAGRTLRLMPPGGFVMGSERREQGRRANESARRVTLTRPFYIAAREVTNGEFRRFRPGHASGFVDRRTIDLDGQAVTGVTWADAVEYCNWLSAQEGLPPAYERSGGGWVLRQPVTTGYRLPTEAEWEYAARQVPLAGRARRYEWGEALPPPAGAANLAGAEAAATLPRVLEGWQDEYPSVAPPGKHPANALGLYDLTGNVSEWVHDAYASFDPAGGGTDPFGPAVAGARRVIKGSNWRTGSFADLRPAWREGADGGSQEIGFRVARYAE